jgi:uncharacterized protein (DUF433 family)
LAMIFKGTHSYLGLVCEKSKARLTKKHIQWLEDYPYLESEDIQQSLMYAVWLAREQVYPIKSDKRRNLAGGCIPQQSFASLMPEAYRNIIDNYI